MKLDLTSLKDSLAALDLSPARLRLIHEILSRPIADREVWAFGFLIQVRTHGAQSPLA